MLKLLLPLALYSVLAPSAIPQDPDSSPLVGKPVPNISITKLSGGKISTDDLKGKAIVIDFWASWCGPCKAASPTLQKLTDRYAKKGLVIIAVNLDSENSKGVSAEYAKEHKYSFTFAINGKEAAKKLGLIEGGMIGLPSFIFVDKTGIVRRVETGFSLKDAPKWESYVQELMK